MTLPWRNELYDVKERDWEGTRARVDDEDGNQYKFESIRQSYSSLMANSREPPTVSIRTDQSNELQRNDIH